MPSMGAKQRPGGIEKSVQRLLAPKLLVSPSVNWNKKQAMEKESKKRGSQGLTLVELILCMAILAVLMAVASPLLAQFSSGYKLRAATRELATDLQFARLLAVKENRSFQVICGTQSYQVVRANDGFVAKARDFSADYPDVTLNAPVVTFNSRGNAASQTLTVSNFAASKNISVNSTGRVKLQ
jgi:prepilin-type N-terminal cleavage/methylation domain-containing protein